MHNAAKPSFIRRKGTLILVIVIVVIGAGWLFSALSGSKPAKSKPREFSMVSVALPPPPPPPPPPPQPEPQPRDETPSTINEMTIPDPVAADQPDSATDEPAADGGDSMGTNVQGDGPADGFGLVGRGTGGMIGGGGGLGRGGSGNRSWDSYSAQAGAQMRNALSQHEKTRAASLRLPISIWLDSGGGIERVRLDASSGDPELDRAIESEVFANFRLATPPPADMPQPIRLRINAQRPH